MKERYRSYTDSTFTHFLQVGCTVWSILLYCIVLYLFIFCVSLCGIISFCSFFFTSVFNVIVSTSIKKYKMSGVLQRIYLVSRVLQTLT